MAAAPIGRLTSRGHSCGGSGAGYVCAHLAATSRDTSDKSACLAGVTAVARRGHHCCGEARGSLLWRVAGVTAVASWESLPQRGLERDKCVPTSQRQVATRATNRFASWGSLLWRGAGVTAVAGRGGHCCGELGVTAAAGSGAGYVCAHLAATSRDTSDKSEPRQLVAVVAGCRSKVGTKDSVAAV